MDPIYRALADPTRRKILQLLREKDLTAGQLARHFTLSKPTLSRHFALLRQADLIHAAKDGAAILYTLNRSVLEKAISDLMTMFRIEAPGEP